MSHEAEFQNLRIRLDQSPRASNGKRLIAPELRDEVIATISRHQLGMAAAAELLGLSGSTLWKWQRLHGVSQMGGFRRIPVEKSTPPLAEASLFRLSSAAGFEIHGLRLSDVAALLLEVAP